MKEIKIQIRNKIASLDNKSDYIVCGNNDYVVKFDFDEEWDNHIVKTALFVFGDKTVYRVFDGNESQGVTVDGATICAIGCFSGDLRTTTPAVLKCELSIRDLGGFPSAPEPEVYDEIVSLLNKYISSIRGVPAGGNAGQVLKKNSVKDYDYAWEDEEEPSKDFLSEVIGTANPNNDGLMSAKQAQELASLISMLGEDSDDAINKITEVFAAFEGLQENGGNLFELFEGKADADKSALDKIIGTATDKKDGLMSVEQVRALANLAKEIEKKLSKSSKANVVYANDASGKLTDKAFSEEAVGGALVARDSSGRAKVANVSDYDDGSFVANLGTVKRIANAQTNKIDAVLSAFETEGGYNLLDPNNAESGYYENLDGVLVEKNGSYQLRTIAPISVEGGSTLYIRSDVPENVDNTSIVSCLFIDESGAVLRQLTARLYDIFTKSSLFGVPATATSVHIYINGVSDGRSFKDVCVSTVNLAKFEEYGKPKTPTSLKEEFLPDLANNLKGKKIVFLGDSIFGNEQGATGVVNQVAARVSATVINGAFGGTRMSLRGSTTTGYDKFDFPSIAQAIATGDYSAQEQARADYGLPKQYASSLQALEDTDFNTVDIIVFNHGTNDYTGGVPKEVYQAAMENNIATILQVYPHIKFFAVTPTWRCWITDGAITEDGDGKPYAMGTLPKVVAAMREVAENTLHIPVIDCYNIGINKYNFANYFDGTDGTHQNAKGRELLARRILKGLY